MGTATRTFVAAALEETNGLRRQEPPEAGQVFLGVLGVLGGEAF